MVMVGKAALVEPHQATAAKTWFGPSGRRWGRGGGEWAGRPLRGGGGGVGEVAGVEDAAEWPLPLDQESIKHLRAGRLVVVSGKLGGHLTLERRGVGPS